MTIVGKNIGISMIALLFSVFAFGQFAVPHTEDFETALSWTNDTGDNFDWALNSGGTPSNNTGPNGAHQGSQYLYIEASGGNNPTQQADLSGAFDLSSTTNPKLEFYYHMFGADMGELHVDVNDGTWQLDEWNVTGQQHTSAGQAWTLVSVDLSAYAGNSNLTIRFRGITGTGWRSDICIDQVKVFDDCSVVGGNSNSSVAAICGSGTTDLSLTGHDGGATIQWQQSVNGGAYSDIAGATAANYTTGTLTSTNSYAFRAKVTNGCTFIF